MKYGSPYKASGDARIVLDSIRRIVQVLRIGAAAAERSVGISAAQLFVLENLSAASGPLSIGELAERTLTHQSSVSVVVQKLEKSNLVVRARAAKDTRRVELRPTPQAIQLLRKAPQTAQERIVQAVAAMPGAKRKQLAQLLAALAREVAGEDAPAMFFEDRNHKSMHKKRSQRGA